MKHSLGVITLSLLKGSPRSTSGTLAFRAVLSYWPSSASCQLLNVGMHVQGSVPSSSLSPLPRKPIWSIWFVTSTCPRAKVHLHSVGFPISSCLLSVSTDMRWASQTTAKTQLILTRKAFGGAQHSSALGGARRHSGGARRLSGCLEVPRPWPRPPAPTPKGVPR